MFSIVSLGAVMLLCRVQHFSVGINGRIMVCLEMKMVLMLLLMLLLLFLTF